ncbi:MAG: HAMP domain-containing sensor histidine kinase [Planctomycetota bacterium]|nr:HAMP domain-containing sensor histidine kinase [Planctomycetota bacterium]
MFQSLRNQFVVPLSFTIFVAVGFVTVVAYYFSYRSARQTTEQRLAAVASVAVAASYPLTESVLEQMRGLSSMEIAIVQKADGVILYKTNGIKASEFISDQLSPVTPSEDLLFVHDFFWINQRWDVLIRPIGMIEQSQPRRIVVLSKHENQESLVSQSLYLPIATGSVAAIAVGAIATVFATRISGRIRKLSDHVSRIDLGKSQPLVMQGPQDEIAFLTDNVNRMTSQLKASQQTLASNQRSQLINQFASGMAHQLRNTLTGARLAIQTHQQENESDKSEDLELAVEQLRLAEQSIRSLLQVRSGLAHAASAPQTVESITNQLLRLVQLKAMHRAHEIQSEIQESVKSMMLDDGQSVLGATLNLALNGLEAMVEPGCLSIDVTLTKSPEQQPFCQFVISDTGAGPSAEIESTMMESFSTTKQEGIGIGLPMALSIANRYGGSLTWKREAHRTCFFFAVPVLQFATRDEPTL